MNTIEAKELYMGFSPAQKEAFMDEALLRGGSQYLGEVLMEAYELGIRPKRVSENREAAQVVTLMTVRGGLL